MAERYRGRTPGRVVNRLLSPFYLDVGGDHRDAVMLAGSGRSGTTWASEVINYRGEYRYVFEPFHPRQVELASGFRWKQYLRPGDGRKDFLEAARAILSGRVRGAWPDRFHRRFVARRRLVKDIRVNLMLGWLRANFPEMPVVLILRHPCAVAESKVRLGWKSRIEEVLEQPALIEDFLEPFVDEIRAVSRVAENDFERHVFVWCVENYVPLMQLARNGAHLVFYENLCEKPQEEVARLFSFLGKDFDEKVIDRMRKPSSLSREGSAVMLGRRPADSWRRSVTGAQVRRSAEILGLFGLDEIYGREPMPHVAAAYDFMRPSGSGCSGGGADSRERFG